GTVGHWLPVVRPRWARHVDERGVDVPRPRVFNRTPRCRIYSRRPPGIGHERLGRNGLPGFPVNHIEEAVLGGLHEHLAELPCDLEIGEDHRLHRRVVPAFAGIYLVAPDVFPGVGIDGYDRGQEQIVAAALRTRVVVVRCAVTRANVEAVQLTIIDDRVPRRTSAAVLPIVIPEPGRARDLFKRLIGGLTILHARVARYG